MVRKSPRWPGRCCSPNLPCVSNQVRNWCRIMISWLTPHSLMGWREKERECGGRGPLILIVYLMLKFLENKKRTICTVLCLSSWGCHLKHFLLSEYFSHYERFKQKHFGGIFHGALHIRVVNDDIYILLVYIVCFFVCFLSLLFTQCHKWIIHRIKIIQF